MRKRSVAPSVELSHSKRKAWVSNPCQAAHFSHSVTETEVFRSVSLQQEAYLRTVIVQTSFVKIPPILFVCNISTTSVLLFIRVGTFVYS